MTVQVKLLQKCLEILVVTVLILLQDQLLEFGPIMEPKLLLVYLLLEVNPKPFQQTNSDSM